MNFYLENLSSMKVQKDHPKSPFYIYISGEWLGSLKGSDHNKEVMIMLQKVYDEGLKKGKEQRSAELRRLL